ncbi:MAG: hypothetical protein JWL83_4530 [Actinomycetia bacterium]|nr:hypothetical protein [Actinomycetes bacterium]
MWARMWKVPKLAREAGRVEAQSVGPGYRAAMAGHNRLASETSPYLRQHRDNPVDWYAWGDDAFARARDDDKPIFLSVGYSACHWCHVMAHESFEDPATAALMNDLFVNVKVDREERPDVDGVYMQAVQAMTGRGGWPMSVWLMPDGRPFYGGTYYPNDDRPGMPSFRRVCEAVADAWRERRSDLSESAEKLTEAIDTPELQAATAGDLDPALLSAALQNIGAQFDARDGGFGRAPKFPQAMTIDFLCHAYVANPSPDTATMIRTSLDAMAAGGIYDQIGGGFARYSTDDFWLTPHFEKMLYDNALLTRAYLHAYLITGESRYRRVVEETVEYVLRDLHHPDGGFFSAEDADSEGIEGKFYLWSREEIREVCGDDAEEVERYYGITAGGNFIDPHTDFRGNILHVVNRTEAPPAAVQRSRPKLFERRSRRVRPGLDDKVLLGWNALFLAALAEAGAAFERADWLDAARTNARFLLRELRRDDGRLLRSWQADADVHPATGRARHLAYAEDHAALTEALVTMAEVDDVVWLDDAREVADQLLVLFADPDGPGFFTVGDDAEQLIVRQKDLFDNATPSANSLAASALLRLAALTGDARYETAANASLRAVGPAAGSHPTTFAYLLTALERRVLPPIEIAIVGDPDDPATRDLRREVLGRLIPASVTLTATAGPGTERSPLFEGRAGDGTPLAYVCEHFACRLPVADADALRSEIDAALAGRSIERS